MGLGRNKTGATADLKAVQSLEEIFRLVDSCKTCKIAGNRFQHIHGGGETKRPVICFVLINPTYRNLSASSTYSGPRFPFIGVRQFWKVIADGGFFGGEGLQVTESGQWNEAGIRMVESELKRRKVYLTNIVKCTFDNPTPPPISRFKNDLPLFWREMELLQPQSIVAFGKLPISLLTGVDLKLNDYYQKSIGKGSLTPIISNGGQSPLPPIYGCFFPVGRGEPRKASELLRLLSISLDKE